MNYPEEVFFMKKILLICHNIRSNSTHEYVRLGLDNIRDYAMQQDDLKSQLDIEIMSLIMDYDVNEAINEIAGKAPDVLGFSTCIWNVYEFIILAESIKKLIPEIKIIFGGPQVSDIHWDIMQFSPHIDGVIRGEGEITFSEVVRFWLKTGNLYSESIPGFSFRGQNGKVIHNPDRPLIVDLDIIPHRYKNFKAYPEVVYPFETTRGCYNKCGFCNWGIRAFHKHSLNYLLDEIDYMAEAGIKIIDIEDNSFTFNRSRMLQIGRRLADHGIRYACCGKPEEMDEEIMDILLETGVSKIELGLQTTNPAALKIMKRNFDIELYKRNVEMILEKCQGTDVEIIIDTICGLPGDNLQTFCQTLDFAYNLKPHKISSYTLILLPGTDFFINKEKYGIRYKDFSREYGMAKNRYNVNKFGSVLENMSFSQKEMEIGRCICMLSMIMQNKKLVKSVYEKIEKDNITFTQLYNEFEKYLPDSFFKVIEADEDIDPKLLMVKKALIQVFQP
jgi:Fe-S oxidoreductase